MNAHSATALFLPTSQSYGIVGVILPIWYDDSVVCWNGDGDEIMRDGVRMGKIHGNGVGQEKFMGIGTILFYHVTV